MRCWLPIVLLLTSSLVSSQAQAEYEEEAVDETHVVVLTDATHDETLASREYVLVEYYAPWCGHCKALKPQYADAAAELAEAEVPVTLAKLDATENKAAAAQAKVTGYPTLIWYIKSKPQPYNGGRTSEDIVKWVLRKTGPPAFLVKGEDELSRATAGKRVYLLGYFSQLEGAEYDAFTTVARANDDVDFLETTSAAVAKAAGLGARAPAFLLGTAHAGFQPQALPAAKHPAFQTDGELEEQLGALLLAEKLPPYLPFSRDTQAAVFSSGIDKQVFVMAEEKDLTPGSATIVALKGAHAEFKGRLVFVTVANSSETFSSVAQFFGADMQSREPQVFGMVGQKRYLMQQPFGPQALQKFAQGVVDGTLAPNLRSEEPPEQDHEGDVLVVVGKTFDSLVLNDSTDVFLEVYSPNCGHCKALAPTWSKLARQLRKVPSVEVAKMDGTANEHALLSGVEGFPHLVLFPAGADAQPVPYKGDRSMKDLRRFLKANAGIPFQIPKKGIKQSREGEDEL